MSPMNLAGVLPWTYWRGLSVIALLAAGNVFCMACPFMLPRDLGRRLLPARWRWPRALRSKWLAVALLLALPVGLRGVQSVGQPVVDGVDHRRLLRRGVRRRRALPRRQLLQVRLPDRPVQLRPVAAVAARGQRHATPTSAGVCTTHDCIRGNEQHRGCELRPVPAAEGRQPRLHLLPRLRPRLPARQRRHPRGAAGERSAATTHRSSLRRLSRRPDVAALALVLVVRCLRQRRGDGRRRCCVGSRGRDRRPVRLPSYRSRVALLLAVSSFPRSP